MVKPNNCGMERYALPCYSLLKFVPYLNVIEALLTEVVRFWIDRTKFTARAMQGAHFFCLSPRQENDISVYRKD